MTDQDVKTTKKAAGKEEQKRIKLLEQQVSMEREKNERLEKEDMERMVQMQHQVQMEQERREKLERERAAGLEKARREVDRSTGRNWSWRRN